MLRVRVNSWIRRTVWAPSWAAWRIMPRLSATSGAWPRARSSSVRSITIAEQIVEIVGHARGHLAQRAQPLDLDELILGLLDPLQRALQLRVQPRVLHRDAGLRGEGGGHRHVVLRAGGGWLVTALSTPTSRSPARTGTESQARRPSLVAISACSGFRMAEPARSGIASGSPEAATPPHGPSPTAISAGSRASTPSPRASVRTSRSSSTRWKATVSAWSRPQ